MKSTAESFQEAVDEVLSEVRSTLVAKQADYGPANIDEFGALGVLVRANDKMARLKHLQWKDGPPENEAVDDSWMDLAGYAAIALMQRRGTWGLPVGHGVSEALGDYHEMSEEQRNVLEFHERFGCAVASAPSLADMSTAALRVALIREELEELADAEMRADLPAIADAIGDLLYVVYGAAVAHGLNMRPIMRLIHEANMRKVGGATRADGKILKPEGWQPPNISREVVEQREKGSWGVRRVEYQPVERGIRLQEARS